MVLSIAITQKGGIIMECPICKEEMKRGYIRCNNGIYPMVWKAYESSLSKKLLPWYNNFTKIKLDNVFYCEKCEIIIKKINSSKTDNS